LLDADRILGLFINTLPVTCTPRTAQSTRSFLRELQAKNLDLREFEHTPLYDLQRWAGRPGRSLFDTLVVYDNFPVDRLLQGDGEDDVRFEVPELGDATNLPLAWSAWHYAIASALALGAAGIAGYLPARKAARLNPVDIIRGAT